jgi:hypothetical protein
MYFLVTSIIGRALYASLARLWPRLRADADLPRQTPLAPISYARMAHALHRIPWLLDRIDRLAQRWHAGTLPPPRPSRAPRPAPPAATPTPARQRDSSAHARQRDPSAHGWLARIHHPARQIAGQVEHLLAQPDTRAFVAAAPQAGRLLRPLCRMLGATPPDWLKLPPRPKRPAKPRPARPRPPALTDPSLGLRPYVIAAARAWRSKNG